MSMPRLRFRVWWMMATVTALALILGYLRRPHPVRTSIFPAGAETRLSRYEIVQDWSDGQVRYINAHSYDGQIQNLKASEPWSISRRRFGPVLQVNWSDGTASYYLDGN